MDKLPTSGEYGKTSEPIPYIANDKSKEFESLNTSELIEVAKRAFKNKANISLEEHRSIIKAINQKLPGKEMKNVVQKLFPGKETKQLKDLKNGLEGYVSIKEMEKEPREQRNFILGRLEAFAKEFEKIKASSLGRQEKLNRYEATQIASKAGAIYSKLEELKPELEDVSTKDRKDFEESIDNLKMEISNFIEQKKFV